MSTDVQKLKVILYYVVLACIIYFILLLVHWLVSSPGAQWGGEKVPGTHCLCMCLISQISGGIILYFSNLPCYVDIIIIN